ncbi:hypothetical protein HDK77DRAFT_137288 [Phyllosticta capitalensis]
MTQQKPSANSATPAAYHAQTAKRGGKEVSPREKGYTDQQVLSEIQAAIRRIGNVNPLAYAVVGLDDNGDPFTFASEKFNHYKAAIVRTLNSSLAPSALSRPVPAIYADENRVSDWVEIASDSDDSLQHPSNQPQKPSVVNIKPKAPAPIPGKRRRSPSHNQSIYDNADDDDTEEWPANLDPLAMPTVRFEIQDFDQVIYNLGLRFDQMQQLACKVVLKQIIKAIEPKKQSRFPYVNSARKEKENDKPSKKRNKKEEGPDIPPWWPTERQEWWSRLPHPNCKTLTHVRHKEPDHLRKEERLVLGVHLLLWMAEKEGGIDLLEKSTKDCPLKFDQDKGSLERKKLREIFLADIYHLARYWADFIGGGLDGDDLYTMKSYPKQALGPHKKGKNEPRKRARKNSSAESQSGRRSRRQRSSEHELVTSTKQLDLQAQSWEQDQQESNAPFLKEGDHFRFTPGNNQSANNVSSPYQQPTPMHQIYEEPMRYQYDSKQPVNFMEQPGYGINRDQGYMSQYSTYPPEWRSMQPQSSSSFSSPTSLAQNSTTSYPSSNTSFPGNMNYSFNQQVSPAHGYNSPIPQQIGLAIPATEPQMQQMAQAPLPMMHGMRNQGGFDEPQYANAQFRTGSLGHPNLSYGMNGSQFG